MLKALMIYFVAQLASPVRIYPQPAPVLDYIWYPTASLYDPATFCFVASVRECPIKLLDATDGRVSGKSYRRTGRQAQLYL